MNRDTEKEFNELIDDFLKDDYFNSQWEKQYLKLRTKIKSFIDNHY